VIHRGDTVERIAMAAPIELRTDYDAEQLRDLARSSNDPGQVRRLLAISVIYAGEARSTAAAIGGVGLQTVRDWVLRFNVEGPAGLLTGKAPGPRPLLDDQQREALRRIVEDGPIPAVHGVVRWRLVDLAQWIFEEFGIAIGKSALSETLREMGFRRLSARPRHHAQAETAIEDFKKASRQNSRRSGTG
jgi:transposase